MPSSLPGNRGWSESTPWRRKKTDVGASTTALPCWSVGTIKKRRVRAAHHTGPDGGPGDAAPVFAVGFNVDRGGASVAGIGPGPTGGARSARVLWFREPHFFRKTGKKSGIFSFFSVIPVY